MKKSFIRQSRSQMTRAEALLKKTPNEAPLICLETRQLLDADAVFEAWVLERWLDGGGTWILHLVLETSPMTMSSSGSRQKSLTRTCIDRSHPL